MEFFSYRNFLELTLAVSWIGAAFAMLSALAGLLGPALRKSGSQPALAGAGAPADGGGSADADRLRGFRSDRRRVFFRSTSLWAGSARDGSR